MHAWLSRFVPTRLFAAFVAVFLSPAVHAEGVRVFDGSASSSHGGLAGAVASAAPGATLMVASGVYAGFEIDRPLSLFAAPGATVQVLGGVTIRDVHGGRVIVSGLEILPQTEIPGHGIEVVDCTAGIRIHSCTVVGAGFSRVETRKDGARVSDSSNVVFQGCVLVGSDGHHCTGGSYTFSGWGGNGLSIFGDSRVALFDCEVVGGESTICDFNGPAGRGAQVNSGSTLFASGSSLRRGMFHTNDSPSFGLDVLANASVDTLDCVITGG